MFPPPNQSVPSNQRSWSAYENNTNAGFGGATYQQGFAANSAHPGLHRPPSQNPPLHHNYNQQQYQQQSVNSLKTPNTATAAPVNRRPKRAKRHRKRHVPVGPAGLWFQQQQQKSSKPGTGAPAQAGSNTTSTGTQKDDDDENDVYKIGVKEPPHRRQELTKPSSFYSPAWTTMQIDYRWTTPSIPANVQSVEERAKLIRPHAPMSFWLISEIKDRLDAAKEWNVLDKNLMVLVEDVHEHHWLLWTVTLTDETGAKIHAWIDPNMVQEEQKHYFSANGGGNQNSKKGDDGSIAKRYIQVGYVWHLVGCSVMLKQRTEEEMEEDGPSENRSPEEESSPERMLLIGSHNIKSVWTPDDLNHVDDEKYVAWMEQRNTIGGEALERSVAIAATQRQESSGPTTTTGVHSSQQHSISLQHDNGSESSADPRQDIFQLSQRYERALTDIPNRAEDSVTDSQVSSNHRVTTRATLSTKQLSSVHQDSRGKTCPPSNEVTNPHRFDQIFDHRNSPPIPSRRPVSSMGNPYQQKSSEAGLPVNANEKRHGTSESHPSPLSNNVTDSAIQGGQRTVSDHSLPETESTNPRAQSEKVSKSKAKETTETAIATTTTPPAQPQVGTRKKRSLEKNPFSQFMATPLTPPVDAAQSPIEDGSLLDDLNTTPKQRSGKKKKKRKKTPPVNQGNPSKLWTSGFESDDFSLSDDEDGSIGAAKEATKPSPTNVDTNQGEQTAKRAGLAPSTSASSEDEQATNRPNAMASLFVDHGEDEELEWSDDD